MHKPVYISLMGVLAILAALIILHRLPLAGAASLLSLQVTNNPGTSQIVSWTRPEGDAPIGLNLYVVTDNTNPATVPFMDIATRQITSRTDVSRTFSTVSLPPGSYWVRAEYGTDWATMIRGDTWDMKESTDVYADGSGSNATLSFAGGVMTGVTKAGDPYFTLGFNPATPISASVYSKLSFQMTSPKANFYQVFWVRQGDAGFDMDNRTIGPFSNPTIASTKVYTLDLARNANWNGSITYLRIDPIHDANVGETWQVDWVTLGSEFVTQEPAASTVWSNAFTVTTSGAQISLSSPLAVSPPTLSEADDYAKTVLGDPWDMSEITDIRQERSFNITSVSLSDGLLTATSGTDDNAQNTSKNPSNPQIYLLYPGYPGSQENGRIGVNFPIDATRYKQLSFRMWLSEAVYLPGTREDVARVYWTADEGFVNYGFSNGVPLYAGWHTYVVDLTSIGRFSGITDWGGSILGLRLDPTTAAGVTFKIDWIRLTPKDSGATTHSITWTRPNDDTTAVINLDVVTNTTSPIYSSIARGLVSAGSSSYSWGTAGLPPGRYYVQAEGGNDWATMIRGDSWDFSQITDIFTTSDKLTNTVASVQSGILSGQTTATENYFFLNFNPLTPISGTLFNRLSFRLNSPQSYSYRLIWYTAEAPGVANFYFANEAAQILPSTTAGWKTYVVDLSGNSNWSGKNISYIRLSPVHDLASVTWQLDWVTLGPPGSTPGDTNVAESFSPGFLTVNNAPYIAITQPSMSTGDDYATATLGNPWDMTDVTDILSPWASIQTLVDIDSYNFNDSMLNAVTKGTKMFTTPQGFPASDSQVWLNTGVVEDKSNTTIDTTKYKYFTWRYYQEGKQDTNYGWVTRLIWWNEDAGKDCSVTKDIVIEEGWHTYKLDLTQARLEPVQPGVVECSRGWVAGPVKYFRFDPNEVANADSTLKSNFHLDYVKITAPDAAYGSFAITWNAAGGITPTVDLYYDTDTNPNNGKTAITTGVSAAAGSYTWNTASVPQGTYYVYAEIKDAYNTTARYSESPLVVRGAPSVSFTSPAGTAPSVAAGDDYATTVLGNAWNMSDSSDLSADNPPSGLSGYVDSGLYVAQTTNNDPYIYLNVDVNRPIDASKYTRLAFKLYLSAPGLWQVQWSPAPGQNFATELFIARQGWNEYTLNMAGRIGWSGSVKYLRLDPIDQNGVTVKLAGVRLTSPASSSLAIQWGGSNLAGSTISLYYDTDATGRDGVLIASGITGSTTQYAWDTSGLEPGRYFVYARVDDGVGAAQYFYSGVPVTVGTVSGQDLPQKIYVPIIVKNYALGW